MPIIQSVRPKFHFLLSEANDWRSRDEVEVEAATGSDDLLAGSILQAGATAADPLVVRTTGAAVGILCQSVKAGETAKRTIIARDAEVVGEDLVIASGDDAPTQAKVDALKPILAPLGIIVRDSGTDNKA